jgi:mannose/fructose/N-acetylgalactosamine-specific phosphotransferase system component IID
VNEASSINAMRGQTQALTEGVSILGTAALAALIVKTFLKSYRIQTASRLSCKCKKRRTYPRS